MSKKTETIRKFVIEDWGDGTGAYTCEWEIGNTTGPSDSIHMQQLLERARREGKPIVRRVW